MGSHGHRHRPRSRPSARQREPQQGVTVILTRQRPLRRPIAAVGLAVAGLLLTGCGSSLGVRPGTAAAVGTDTLSMDKIAPKTLLYCKAYVASQKQSSQQQ